MLRHSPDSVNNKARVVGKAERSAHAGRYVVRTRGSSVSAA